MDDTQTLSGHRAGVLTKPAPFRWVERLYEWPSEDGDDVIIEDCIRVLQYLDGDTYKDVPTVKEQ